MSMVMLGVGTLWFGQAAAPRYGALLRLAQLPVCSEGEDDFSDGQNSLYRQFVMPLEIVLNKQDAITQLTS